MTKYERTRYRRRNAAVALATHLVEQAAVCSVPWDPNMPGKRYEDAIHKAHARVERAVGTSRWMSGFHIDCTNLTKREERQVLEDLGTLLTQARVTIHRGYKLRPRFIEVTLAA